jgi:hypothetical protein
MGRTDPTAVRRIGVGTLSQAGAILEVVRGWAGSPEKLPVTDPNLTIDFVNYHFARRWIPPYVVDRQHNRDKVRILTSLPVVSITLSTFSRIVSFEIP